MGGGGANTRGRSEIHDFDFARLVRTAPGFQNEGLVGSRVNRDTTPEREGIRGAVRDLESDGTGAEAADDRVSLLAYGVGNRNQSLLRVVGNKSVRVRLPSHIGGGQQFRRKRTGIAESGAVRKKGDRRNGLIQGTEQVDLGPVGARRVGVGHCGCAGDGIDSHTLGCCRVRDWENQVRTAVKDRPAGCRVTDRKSTRLNSSHSSISYAVFCLKKKKNTRRPQFTLEQLRTQSF